MTTPALHATPTTARAGRREWLALAVLALPLLLVSMDVAVLYFAVPFISRDLHATASQQLWIFDIYGFVLAGLLITMGALSDRFGGRRVLLIGAAGFGLASLGAALAHTAPTLILARALLGAAGATLMPSTLGLIRTLFQDAGDRARAIGIWSGVMAGGVSLGPVISGALLQHFSWNSVFLINIPAMLLLLALGPTLLPHVAPQRAARVDMPSAALSLTAILPTIFAIKEWALGTPGWPVIAGLVIGLASAALFLARQRHLAHPLLDLKLLTHPVTGGALTASLIAVMTLIANTLFVTQYLQLVLGLAPLTAALWSLVPSALVGVTSTTAPALFTRLGRAPVLAGSFAVATAGFLLMATVTAHSTLPLVLTACALIAGGLVPVMVNVTDVILGAVPPEQAGRASALSESVSELGGSLGVAILGSLGGLAYRNALHLPGSLPAAVRLRATDSLDSAMGAAQGLPQHTAQALLAATREAFSSAYSWVGVACASLTVLAAIVTLLRLREPRAQH